MTASSCFTLSLSCHIIVFCSGLKQACHILYAENGRADKVLKGEQRFQKGHNLFFTSAAVFINKAYCNKFQKCSLRFPPLPYKEGNMSDGRQRLRNCHSWQTWPILALHSSYLCVLLTANSERCHG